MDVYFLGGGVWWTGFQPALINGSHMFAYFFLFFLLWRYGEQWLLLGSSSFPNDLITMLCKLNNKLRALSALNLRRHSIIDVKGISPYSGRGTFRPLALGTA